MHLPINGNEGECASRFRWLYLVRNFVQRSYFQYILVSIKILLGLVLLILSIQGIRWKDLVSGIRNADISWLTLAVLCVLLGLSLKFWRWIMFVRNYKIRTSFTKMFSAYFVGLAVNIVLPFRSGEIVRVGYFAGEPKVIPEVTLTVVLEKYMDLLALFSCSILVSLKFSLNNIHNLRAWLLPLTIFLTILFMVVIFFGPSILKKLQAGNLPDRLRYWLDGWVQANQWLRHPKQVLPGILLTILIWVVMWLTNLLLFKSSGLSLGGNAAALVLVLVYIGLLPALMPGNIGPFYFFASLALLPFGIVYERAFIFAVMLHAIVSLPPIFAGLIGLLLQPRRKMSI